MSLSATFDPQLWARVPFHFWSVTFFVFGCIVGSFLNVCIYRMPIGESVVSPPSHCPHCRYSIPWFLNVPLFTWLYLQGKCANCRAPISIRYFLVELLTGLLFMAAWLDYGHQSALLALVYSLFLAALVVATFIDLEHFIIPDEITIGGMAVGFVCSFIVPDLHDVSNPGDSLKYGIVGMAFGGGLVYAVLRLGKLAFGRYRIDLPPASPVIFTETGIVLPNQNIPFEEVFFRDSDAIKLEASRVELCDRCYTNVRVSLSRLQLKIGDDLLNPEDVPSMELVTSQLVMPREAMGLGDVKFMAAIGAFLGWQGVLFSLMASSCIGALTSGILILLRRRAWSGLIPYGPYIALAAAIWLFGKAQIMVLARIWMGLP